MVDVLFVLLLIIFFYKARFLKPVCSLNQSEYLSIDTTKHYRGFFAIVILFHHLAQCVETGIFFYFFRSVGYLAVAFFFFLSGYGLQKSYITKSDCYRKGFILKRIPSILIPYIIITAIYWMANFVYGNCYSLKDIVFAIANGSPIALHSWYIICILTFYVVYWLIMTFCKKHYFVMILCGLAWCFLYVIFCMMMRYGDWWYNTSHLLIIGMIWATYESSILDLLNKYYPYIALSIWVSFIVLFSFFDKIVAATNISLFLTLTVAALFVLSILMISLKVQIGNKILWFLGEISLEIYLSHGLFIKALRSDWIYIENDLLWCVLVLVSTIAFSYCLHKTFQFILNKYKCLLCD